MKQILIVEDSKFFGVLLQKRLAEEGGYEVAWAQNMAEAVALLDAPASDYFAGILDFNLPDAPNGEIIDELVARCIPAIVFTGGVNAEVRDIVWSKDVVDYILKGDRRAPEYIVTLLNRLHRNATTKVLVVDDTAFFRKVIGDLLIIRRYQVLFATNGKEALTALAKNPEIKLVITDFNMPEMDGFQLTEAIRDKHPKEELAVIGISAQGDHVMAARFIKHGANDFIIKQSFLTEEFYSRVGQCIENLENIERIRDAAIKDYLTGLHNRRYFFDTGDKLFASASRKNIPLVCGMLDIDFFKKVNDTYGHDAGDLALQQVSAILRKQTRTTDIVARMGGEEFCILAANLNADKTDAFFEGIRAQVAATPVDIGNGETITVTISIGVAAQNADSLDDLVKIADAQLYAAKKGGRNRVMVTRQVG